MIAPFYLHWGQVSQSITVSGGDPASGNISARVASGVNSALPGRGKSKSVSGRGSSKSMKGSGGNG